MSALCLLRCKLEQRYIFFTNGKNSSISSQQCTVLKRLRAPSSPMFTWKRARTSWERFLSTASACLLLTVNFSSLNLFPGGFERQLLKIVTGIVDVLASADLWIGILTLTDSGPEDSSHVSPDSYLTSMSSKGCSVGLHNKSDISSTDGPYPWKSIF